MIDLKVTNLNMQRGHNTVARDISLELQAGDILGVIGKNGCGKSSLLQALYGTVKPQSINMTFNGAQASPSKNRHNRIFAYLPQDPFLFKHISVNETIHTWFPDHKDQDRLLYEPLIHRNNKHRVGSLSMGERRFLEFMLVMNLEQPIVLLDEPFSALAPLHIERAIGFIKECSVHKAVIITDHYYEHVLKTANKNLLLHNGTLNVATKQELVEMGYLPDCY